VPILAGLAEAAREEAMTLGRPSLFEVAPAQ
jgi:hypothetical protein